MIAAIYSKLRRITTNQLYLPEIDGIRFLAIAMVVLFHTHGYFVNKTTLHFTDNPSDYSLLNTFLINGDRGVELFFVLSGFILCLPFAHYYINNGKKVSLKNYYLRRLTRLEPPYFIAITTLFFIHIFMNVHPLSVLFPSWLASMAYAHNIVFNHHPLITVVAWSLEIEIQFYILAPLLFTVLSLPKPGRRTILFLAIAGFVCLQSVYRLPVLCIYRFAQYFLMGILLADFYVSGSGKQFFSRKWIVLPFILCLAVTIYLPFKDKSLTPGMLLFFRLCLPFIIGLLYYIILKNDAVKQVFSHKFIPVIGGMCYSIYLLHYTVISFVGRFTTGLHVTNYYLPNLLLQIILLCIPVLAISSVFYYYIERPFMAGKWLDMLTGKNKKSTKTNKVR